MSEHHEKKALPSIRTRDLNEKRKKTERGRRRPRDVAALKINPSQDIDFPLDPNTKARCEGILVLENVTTEQRDVAFKIKTTAPQRYRVRPTSGVIKHGERCYVRFMISKDEVRSILRQIETGTMRKKPDRFMLMSIVANTEESFHPDSLDEDSTLWSTPKWRKRLVKYKFRANIFRRILISDDSDSEDDDQDVEREQEEEEEEEGKREQEKKEKRKQEEQEEKKSEPFIRVDENIIRFVWTEVIHDSNAISDNTSLLPPPPVGELFLRNTSNSRRAIYKIKTTAPKRYATRPTYGIVEKSRASRIRVLIRAEEAARIALEREVTSDRFLVLVRTVETEEEIVSNSLESMRKVWNESSTSKTEHQIKLSVKFVFPSVRHVPRRERVRIIGQGRFGSVFLVRDKKKQNSEFAMKEITLKPDDVELALNEIHVVKSLSPHPHLITYFDAEFEETQDGMMKVRIFTELVTPGSVLMLLREHGPFPEPLLSSCFAQLLMAVEYMHSRGVAHRDIKGANVLLSDDGVLKLADFGAAIYFARLNSSDRRTLEGTAHWMAPEVIKDQDEDTKTDWCKADVWSLACTFIEMATSKRPWSDLNNAVTAMFHIASTLDHPELPPLENDTSSSSTSSGTPISRSTRDLLLQCFSRRANERPSVSEMLKHEYIQSSSRPLNLSCLAPRPPDPTTISTTNNLVHHDNMERKDSTPTLLSACVIGLAAALKRLRSNMRKLRIDALKRGWNLSVDDRDGKRRRPGSHLTPELSALIELRHRAKETLRSIDADRFLCRKRDRIVKTRPISAILEEDDGVDASVSEESDENVDAPPVPAVTNQEGENEEEEEKKRNMMSKLSSSSSSEDEDEKNSTSRTTTPIPGVRDFLRSWLAKSRQNIAAQRQGKSSLVHQSICTWIPLLERRLAHASEIYKELNRLKKTYEQSRKLYKKFEITLVSRLDHVTELLAEEQKSKDRGTIAHRFLNKEVRRLASQRRSLQRRIVRIRTACEKFQQSMTRRATPVIENAVTRAGGLVGYVSRQLDRIAIPAVASVRWTCTQCGENEIYASSGTCRRCNQKLTIRKTVPGPAPPPLPPSSTTDLQQQDCIPPPSISTIEEEAKIPSDSKRKKSPSPFTFTDLEIRHFKQSSDTCHPMIPSTQTTKAFSDTPLPPTLMLTPRGDVGGGNNNNLTASNMVVIPETPPPMTPGGRALFAVALADYEATEDSELSISRGDVIRVVRKHASGWWEGELNLRRGFFPSNYVKVQYDLWTIEEVETPRSVSEVETPRSAVSTE